MRIFAPKIIQNYYVTPCLSLCDDIDYETVGANGSMLMVATSGTAVVI